MRILVSGLLGLWFAAAPLTALAEGLAIVVSVQSYDRLGNARGSNTVLDLRDPLEAAGFEVVELRDLGASEVQSRMSSLSGRVRPAERVVVVLAGHVVSSAGDAWLLGSDADGLDRFTVGGAGLSLNAVLDLVETKPGAALVTVSRADARLRVGPGLGAGFVAPEVPQGVTLLAGPAGDIVEVLEEGLLRPGTSVAAALEDGPRSVLPFGFRPSAVPFLPAVGEPASGPDAEEEALWREAERGADAEDYERYLDRYPDGAFAGEARARIDALRDTPEARAEAAEADLALNRDARRAIQRNLAILGHDPRGIDGIFGRGTRAAIRSWQGAEDLAETGFLTGNQVARLQVQADRRAAELEEEARLRQEEADRRDTAYWRDTGRGETEQGLRQYLEEYPDGLFADIARERLAVIEEERRATAEAEDRRSWEVASRTNTVAAYRAYLQEFPEGSFAEEAQARLRELQREEGQSAAIEAARAEEARVLVNPITRLLVERRLAQLGLEPGAADGRFDEDTRRAVRRYQRARDLPVTGYVTQATLVRMLQGGG